MKLHNRIIVSFLIFAGLQTMALKSANEGNAQIVVSAQELVEDDDEPMALSEHQELFAKDVMMLLMYMDSLGYRFTFGETMRTPEQAALYAAKGVGIKDSLHCKRLAIDINLFDPDGKFIKFSQGHHDFGQYWKSLHPHHNRWGGDFPRQDGNHYERHEAPVL